MTRTFTELDRRKNSDRRTENSVQVINALDTAMERGEIEVLFQPQFATADGKLIGAEALSRWNHPDLGTIGAEALFGVATRAEYLRQLTRHVIRAALTAASGWAPGLRLSVNIAAADLAGDMFLDVIRAALEEATFAPERLTLEITEQSLVDELDQSAVRLKLLADLGVRIALDDFGAGFCNFRYLQRLPLHCLKLDRILLEGIDTNPRDLAVLRGILAMASALDLDVIAEGIERKGQLDAIVNEGCAGWQGFLGARPMPALQFAEFARRPSFPAA